MLDQDNRPNVPELPEATRSLSYESPRDRVMRDPPPNVLKMTFAFATALSVAVVMGLFTGVVLFLVGDGLREHDHLLFRLFAAFYALALVAVIYGVVRAFRRPGLKTVERWWILGYLFGLGLSCLIEGCCFAVSS